MSNTWTDWQGREWKVTTMRGRLKFKIPCHAALRAHVFHRDGYKCVRCGEPAPRVPADYTGRHALSTRKCDGQGWSILLVVDHILTLKAGGRNVVENLQTLCELCNLHKQVEDKRATAAYLGSRC